MNSMTTVDETMRRRDAASRVSIIIPTYNYGRFITQAIESVQAQTYKHWECLVIDDGSTDNTGEIVERFAARDERIKYVYQSKSGVSAARNVGIKRNTGAYVQFLDADDLLEANKLARHVEYLNRHSDVDIVYGDSRYFTDGNPNQRLYGMRGETRPWQPQVSGCGRRVMPCLVRRNIMVISSPLIRRKVFETSGMFDETLSYYEDWDFFVRCAAHEKCFAYQDFDGTRALIRIHETSASKNLKRMNEGLLRVRSKIERLVADENVRGINRELIIQDRGMGGIIEIMDGDWRRGYRALFAAGMRSRKFKHRARWVLAIIGAMVMPPRHLLNFMHTPGKELPGFAWRKLKAAL